MSTGSSLPAMSNAAFAGFLRLLLTPLAEDPRPSLELQAYLDYLSRVYPPEERMRSLVVAGSNDRGRAA